MLQWSTEQQQELARYSYSYEKELFNETSPFQKVQVIETKAYGRMLIIDGCIMLTDDDEFVYHEMIAHVPVCYHKDPKTVIVIGGGDGGTVRELLRYPSIEKIICLGLSIARETVKPESATSALIFCFQMAFI